jgi:hypothetical protein
MVDVVRRTWAMPVRVLSLLVAGVLAGCAMVPRERVEESQRLIQSQRAENARLKDQILGLQAQNRDLADRALDDLRRMTARDEAIERLERSVQAYQDDRERLASAYHRLALGMGRMPEESVLESTAEPRGPRADSLPAARNGRRRSRDTEGVWSEGDGESVPPSSPTASGRSGP